MKKYIQVTVLAVLLGAGQIKAQIPNAGFEQLNSDSTLSYWGNVYVMMAWIDSLGVSHSDSIVYDNQFYAASTDAHSGSTALELRNAWNYTSNTGIAGAAGADDDSVFSSWGILNMLPTQGTLFNPFFPINFGFYCKFFPVNGDSAFAQIALWDSSGNQLAHGELIISDSSSTYNLVHAPVIYTTTGFAAFFSLSISNFYTATPGYKQPSFGTRLLVDNIGFNFVSSTIGPDATKSIHQINIYPNPAKDKLKIRVPIELPYEVELLNAIGNCLFKGRNTNEIDVSKLALGAYMIKIKQGALFEVIKFMKE